MFEVQSVRQVASVKGYPYYAYGIYRAQYRQRDGVLTYRLVRSGPRFRSDVKGTTKFASIPVVEGIRHGTPVAVVINDLKKTEKD